MIFVSIVEDEKYFSKYSQKWLYLHSTNPLLKGDII